MTEPPGPFAPSAAPSPYTAPAPAAPTPSPYLTRGAPSQDERYPDPASVPGPELPRRRDRTDLTDRTRTRTRRADRRRRRAGGGMSRGRAVTGALVAGTGLATAGYLQARDDGGTDLPATLDQARTSGSGQVLNGGRANGGSGPAPSAGSLHLSGALRTEHLLNRVTYGPTDQLRAEIARTGSAEWLARQLNPTALADPDGDAVVTMFPHLSLSIADATRTITDPEAFQRELAAAHLGRAIWSRRQLLEVMVDLWSNHFNITCPGRAAAFSRHRFDADIIRPGALGSFESLLQATAVHPAMLAHLDNGTSSGDRPNENYARHLLETHTVGTAAGFSETDVRQAALLLTGFEVHDGVPRYVPDRHHVGKITVLGFSHPNDSADGGHAAVQQFLSYLAHHPATATAVGRRLAVRFVADDPPGALVRRLAETYLAQQTSIVPVLSALLTSPEFAASAGSKLRRPMERLAATVRTLGIGRGSDPRGLIELYWMLDESGHRPLGCPSPSGYPDVAGAWQSPAVALNQFNLVAQLVHGWWPRSLSNPGPARLLRSPPATRVAAVEAVGRRVLGRPPTSAERAAAGQLLTASRLPTTLRRGSWEQQETIGLLATLLLSSPAALTR